MSVIAIIDDDVQIGNVLEKILQGEGYATLRAYSGTEALYLLSDTKPDLVLLDLMMPGLSGEQVLPKIEGIPVIVLSAKTDIQDKVDLLLNGAADYITKPFNTKELLARITVQLRRGQNRSAGNRLCYGDIGKDYIETVWGIEYRINSHTGHISAECISGTLTIHLKL